MDLLLSINGFRNRKFVFLLGTALTAMLAASAFLASWVLAAEKLQIVAASPLDRRWRMPGAGTGPPMSCLPL